MAMSKWHNQLPDLTNCYLPIANCFFPKTRPPPQRRPIAKLAALLLCGLFVLAAETLDTAGGVHQLLLAGKKRMAIGADFHVDRALVRGPCNELVAARAVYAYFIVSGMNRCFH